MKVKPVFPLLTEMQKIRYVAVEAHKCRVPPEAYALGVLVAEHDVDVRGLEFALPELRRHFSRGRLYGFVDQQKKKKDKVA